MPFTPINERHAIREVAFALTFSKNFSNEEMDQLVAAHKQWKAQLPKKTRPRAMQFIMDEQGARPDDQANVVLGVQFERFKADGSLDWRLRADDKLLIVNCLTYTRWDDIWPRARALFLQASGALAPKNNPVMEVGLQYIDVFEWEGDIADYDSRELLRDGSRFIPSSIWNRGAVWHLHQGWFRNDGLQRGCKRVLDRMHIDAVESSQKFVVKMDNTQRLDFAEGVPVASLFKGLAPLIDQTYNQFHDNNKQTLREYLTDSMIERIALNA